MAVATRARTVGDIALELPVSRPAVSQHLKVLKEAGWLDETRVGTRHFFRMKPATALALRNHFEAMWQQAMHAYARHVIEKETHDERSHDKRRKSRR